MSTGGKRGYRAGRRAQSAQATRSNVLRAAGQLFSQRGIDKVTVAEIATEASVAPSTVYALFESKEGMLRELMQAALFGARFRAAQALTGEADDPPRLVALTARIARAIYESEADQLGLLRGASAFSPSLRRLEEEFEDLRFAMQEERLRRLEANGQLKESLSFDEARRIMWMYTSRDVYRMLVGAGGWNPDRYESWLSETLVQALVAQ